MADTPPTDALRGGLPDRYLTPDDVADLFHVPKETVYEWRKKRCGPPGFRVGKYLRYDPDVVRCWAEQQMRADAEAA